MGEDILQTKSFRFAIEIVKLYKQLSTVTRDFVLSKQLLKSGTTIGANVEEAFGAPGEADFLNKLNLAHKEACVASYWIRLLRETNTIDNTKSKKLLDDCDELQRIIYSNIKTVEENQAK
jgi:four helix bundle protein